MRYAYVGPDWSENYSRHVISKGAMGFVQALSKYLDITRIVNYEELAEYDALILFHHLTAGFYLYENPTYSRLIRLVTDNLENIKIPVFLWHVEPAPTYGSMSQKQVELADCVLTSSALSMFGATPTIYVPNGCYKEMIHRKLKVENPVKYSVPMNLKYMAALNRTGDLTPGSRLDTLRKYAWDLELDIFGDGWKEVREHCSPKWHLHPQAIGSRAFESYEYVLEIVEQEHLQDLNAIGYCSDRIGWALSYGCHLVTNLDWMNKAYESVRSWDRIKEPNSVTQILRDRDSHEWENLARTRSVAIRMMTKKILFDKQNSTK